MGTYAYNATNDTLDLIAGRGNTDELAAKLSKTSDNIAPKQETNTASELIPVGKYFINANGDLCQCDVQIASGGTIITGTNCHVIPDGGVNELNSNSSFVLLPRGMDINNPVGSGFCWWNQATGTPPNGKTAGYVITFIPLNGYFSQIWIDYNDASTYTRVNNGGTWTAWKAL